MNLCHRHELRYCMNKMLDDYRWRRSLCLSLGEGLEGGEKLVASNKRTQVISRSTPCNFITCAFSAQPSLPVKKKKPKPIITHHHGM